jgi:hypothetical protein
MPRFCASPSIHFNPSASSGSYSEKSTSSSTIFVKKEFASNTITGFYFSYSGIYRKYIDIFGKYVDMEHIYYFDGDQKKISWIIENAKSRSEESRIHAEYFYDIVTIEQSKYIALHVGIFWGIGRFIIKNGDTIKVMLDQKSMFDRLVKNRSTEDAFIEKRIKFIEQIISQRDLDVRYQTIDHPENKASELLLSNN